MSNLSLRDFYWLWAMILLFRIGRITEVRIGIRSIISHCAGGVAESLGGGVHDNAEDGENGEDGVACLFGQKAAATGLQSYLRLCIILDRKGVCMNMSIECQRNPGKTAYLTNDRDIISFSYGDRTIRFKGPYSLQRFLNVQEWDHGYLVVEATYAHDPEPVEDYIDLIPILQNLYIDSEAFLKPIERVEVRYAG